MFTLDLPGEPVSERRGERFHVKTRHAGPSTSREDVAVYDLGVSEAPAS